MKKIAEDRLSKREILRRPVILYKTIKFRVGLLRMKCKESFINKVCESHKDYKND
jgi:hypothetical protein